MKISFSFFLITVKNYLIKILKSKICLLLNSKMLQVNILVVDDVILGFGQVVTLKHTHRCIHPYIYINDVPSSQQREVYPVHGMKNTILCRKHTFGKARMLVLQWKW